MKASTLFLGFTLVVLAAALAGLWQAFGPRSVPKPVATRPPVAEAPAQPSVQPKAPPAPPPAIAEQDEPGVRSVYPGGRPSAARAPQPEFPAPMPSAAPPLPPAPPAPAEPPPSQPSAALRPPGLDAPAQPAPVPAPTPVPAEAPAGDAVDLNTAPVEALNGLGAGMIGKAIIANRPYTSPDDLVTRRILKRRDYETIKPRVVVR